MYLFGGNSILFLPWRIHRISLMVVPLGSGLVVGRWGDGLLHLGFYLAWRCDEKQSSKAAETGNRWGGHSLSSKSWGQVQCDIKGLGFLYKRRPAGLPWAVSVKLQAPTEVTLEAEGFDPRQSEGQSGLELGELSLILEGSHSAQSACSAGVWGVKRV